MIDLREETLIALRDVPRWLPRCSMTGKPVHVSAIYRWATRGIQGVTLETIKVGGTTYTSAEALQRFAEHRDQTSHGPNGQPPTTAQRKNQIERASRRVDEILGR